MSHGKQRTKKDCLNCGTIVQGHYCQHCGQENTEPHETFFGMVNHFFSDITHFDGKFFKTLGTLARKPGYLSKLYMEGKRQSFLHPIRMYVFTSAVFFLVFFSMVKVKEDTFGRNGTGNKWADTQVRKYGLQAYREAETAQDSADIRDALEWFYPELSTDTVSKRTTGAANSTDAARLKPDATANKTAVAGGSPATAGLNQDATDSSADAKPVYRFDDGGLSDSIRKRDSASGRLKDKPTGLAANTSGAKGGRNNGTAGETASADNGTGEYNQPAGKSASRKKKNGYSRGYDIIGGKGYKTLAEYDSVQASLSPGQKDGWLTRMFIRKGLDINERYPGEEGKFMALLVDKFLHTIPYILFISLPLYAFFLYLLYIRRKQLFFADHAVFLIHLYIFTFILTLLGMLLNKYPFWGSGFLLAALMLYGVGYTLKAFRNYYGQGWMKTIFKFIVFNFLCLVSLTLLFTIFGGYALFQV